MTKPFNWRDYLTVDNTFGKNKALIEHALDAIAAAAPDGQELITLAHQNSYHRKKIRIHETPGESGANTGEIRLNMHEAGTLYVETPQGEKQISLTGLLVHELFHMADFNLRNDVRYAEKWHYCKTEFTPAIRLEFPFGPSAPIMHPPSKASKKEQDATHYADVFMAKHFPGEPWRGTYDNIYGEDTKREHVFLQKPGCGIYRAGVYEAQDVLYEELGHFTQPTISATPDAHCSVPAKSRR